MKAIEAIYEQGVFRPIEPVELPEGTPVIVEPRNHTMSSTEAARIRIFDTLSKSYSGGQSDDAKRHDEHQP